MDIITELKPNSITEIVLFIILCIIVLIVINLFHYTSIQQTVKKYSRCYKNRALSSIVSNEYSIIGYSLTNIEILKITYDFKEKKSKIEITAPMGSILNKIEIKLYNLKTYEVDSIDKTFYSQMDFNLLKDDMIYIGHPELVRFMQFGNTDFFEKQLFS